MELYDLLAVTFLAAAVTDVATGLGAIPFFFLPRLSERFNGFLLAGAAGMMTIASVLQLLHEAVNRTHGWDIWQPAAGVFLGGGLFALLTRWLHDNPRFDVGNLRATGGAGALMIVAAMTAHSLPEGIAIGVAYGTAGHTGSMQFGLSVAIALAVHNIPEGVAITAALRARGTSTLACFGWSILSSVPQPLAAPFAAWAVWLFDPLLPGGLGFAAGAMMFLVANELIPEAAEKAGKLATGLGFTGGLVLMTLIVELLTMLDAGPAA